MKLFLFIYLSVFLLHVRAQNGTYFFLHCDNFNENFSIVFRLFYKVAKHGGLCVRAPFFSEKHLILLVVSRF